MKKIITLLLLIGGFACAASADDYIISGSHYILNGNHDTDFWWQDGSNMLSETSTSGIYTLVVERCSLTAGENYGFKVKVSEDAWNDNTTFPASPYNINVPYTGTYTLIYYVDIANKGIRVIAQPELRWNLGDNGKGNWDWLIDDSSKFTKDGDFGWTFEVLPDKFTSDFSFRIYSGVFQKQAYPNGQDLALPYGNTASTSAYFNSGSTSWSWKVTKPSCAFDKLIIHAVYNPFANSDGTWDVTANANALVTTNGSGYCTLTTNVPLTISGASAYYATDKGNGSATANAMTNPAANVPMLIKGDAGKTYSFAVAASGTTHSDNAFKAGTGSALASTTDGKYNYILNGNAFFAANDKTVAEGKAYLQLSAAASSRALVFADDEATGIEAVDNMPFANDHSVYNLNGQRVNTPQKGLYIVNGRKVVLK